MSNEFSHSGINRYLSCPKSYYFHYVRRIREEIKSGALFFGSALDKALNSVLLKKGNPHDIFDEAWSEDWHNDVKIKLDDSPIVRYADSDFDKDLLTDFDFMLINEKMKTLNLPIMPPLDLYRTIAADKKDRGFDNLPPDYVKIYNYMNWLVMSRKGHLMIDAYIQKVMPRIVNVISVQKHTTVKSNTGDTLQGYIDIIADVKLDDGTIVRAILDNKTSTSEYDFDAVKTSQQLTIYADLEDIQYGGFFVLRKTIRKDKTKCCSKCNYNGIKDNGKLTTAKTCDAEINGKRCNGDWKETIKFDVDVQIIIDEISDVQKEATLESVDAVNQAIRAKLFPRNVQACHNFGKCPFFGKCHYQNDKGLIELPEKKK